MKHGAGASRVVGAFARRKHRNDPSRAGDRHVPRRNSCYRMVLGEGNVRVSSRALAAGAGNAPEIWPRYLRTPVR